MALEAILSILLMLGMFYVMWGAALIVYNQSKVTAGAQFAAQGALVVYDRSTYRGGYPLPGSGGDGNALIRARSAAESLMRENGQVGMAPDQFTGAVPNVSLGLFDVSCGPSISATGPGLPYASSPCVNSATSAGAAVTSVRVQTAATGSYWLLAPLSNADRGRDASDQKTAILNGLGEAISVSPEATP